MMPLFKREMRTCLVPTAGIVAVLALYTGLVASMFDPDLGESLMRMRDAMSELFDAFGMGEQGTTLLEFLVNYLYGFLFSAFPLALVALLSDRLMVRHVERGTLACLLAQPVGRVRLAAAQFLVMAACLVGSMALLTALEMAVAESMFPGELAWGDLLAVNAATLCLWTFFAGICWASACAIPSVAAARWTGVGVGVACLLAQMVSGVGEELAWLGDITPLALFDPLGVAACSTGAVFGAIVLASAGLALAALGVLAFSRRDLSI